MSTQSSQTAMKTTMQLDNGSSMSNSEIAQAADEAFSHHKRLDTCVGFNEHNSVACYPNPLDSRGNSRVQLRKRKKDFESAMSEYASTAHDFNSDFLSGIFRDISEAEQNSTSSAPNVVSNRNDNDGKMQNRVLDDELSHPKKKFKTRGSINSMSRSRRSFTCLQSLTPTSNPVEHTQVGSSAGDAIPLPARRVSVTSPRVSHILTGASSETGVLDTTCIHNLVDKVLADSKSLVFPRLPPTVSESSCSSNNLTQTSVQAVQGPGTPSSHIEGSVKTKDTYGWFVDMDLDEDSERADVISAAQESCKASIGDDLSFKAFTAPKKPTQLDEEVEWAKAADTVDDVLGDFF